MLVVISDGSSLILLWVECTGAADPGSRERWDSKTMGLLCGDGESPAQSQIHVQLHSDLHVKPTLDEAVVTRMTHKQHNGSRDETHSVLAAVGGDEERRWTKVLQQC